MSIFSCVMGDVQDVVNQVTQQANMVDDVAGRIRSGMGPITGGAWTGQGADAFVNEVQTRLLPQIMALIASIGGFGGGITSAMGMISQADNDVFGVVGNIGDVFDSIF
jgi:uncharacterized protein YukE